mmetsp:Transcript_64840/g.168593  ORF Transcript_64840/g.168593 Transcript_64840/m.168593 type:complete len:205 (+) Transcript_64840:193-807(+)
MGHNGRGHSATVLATSALHHWRSFGRSQLPWHSELPFGSCLAKALSRTSSGGRWTNTRPPSTLASKEAMFKPALLMPLPVSKLYVFLWMGQAIFGTSPCMPMSPRERTCNCLWGQEFCVAYHLPLPTWLYTASSELLTLTAKPPPLGKSSGEPTSTQCQVPSALSFPIFAGPIMVGKSSTAIFFCLRCWLHSKSPNLVSSTLAN